MMTNWAFYNYKTKGIIQGGVRNMQIIISVFQWAKIYSTDFITPDHEANARKIA